MKCEHCGTEAHQGTLAMNGWLEISEMLIFMQPGQIPINGHLCTVSCAIGWLQERLPQGVDES